MKKCLQMHNKNYVFKNVTLGIIDKFGSLTNEFKLIVVSKVTDGKNIILKAKVFVDTIT